MTPEELKVFQDMVDRWSALETKPAFDYSWRTPEASRSASKYIAALLKKHEGSSTRAYMGVRDDDRATVIDAVVAADGVTILGFVDDTWLCPPFCR